MNDNYEKNMRCQMTTREDDSSEEDSIIFHRHCQATVLSANGTENGNGFSWDYIDELELSNLPYNWKTYFTVNHENITQDLASILKLMNDMATVTNVSFTQVQQSGTKIGSISINGNSKDIYAPNAVTISNNINTGTRIATINGIDIYAPSGASSSSSNVNFYQIQTSGTKIGTLTINGSTTDIYSPKVEVTQTIDKEHGIEIGKITIDGITTSLYAPKSSTTYESTDSSLAYDSSATSRGGFITEDYDTMFIGSSSSTSALCDDSDDNEFISDSKNKKHYTYDVRNNCELSIKWEVESGSFKKNSYISVYLGDEPILPNRIFIAKGSQIEDELFSKKIKQGTPIYIETYGVPNLCFYITEFN